ncbi:hypothetical protein AtubIFM56815_002791 [Aspergillus tubingensis]|uniref:Decarboxylase Dec1 n=2 Tax=Aspergillus subgen. Circumdati TaxID=2720871 RepID=A0A100I6B9_ASPNG|nr:decarboxylase Dec1 [Aspergillus tubingensis]GAQ35534.1 decarboxylase Dec1 [Aspergillus niger]GFN13981.1 decarboxylase Dec1 [Aspergillus tubingensis]GLA88342.1 hypothetical protein AtubIFM56815_002791 [Aspergillus tubingensis]GLA94516.1 hypothetical protein AtubIFM57143_001504 [Aspergillus tubingensis]GLB12647.1 hypothetical protein AtubIFM61612_000026 [Aspergillus tubingensis]
MPFGTFELTGDAIPQYAPPYPTGDCDFTGSTILVITYRTTAHSVAPFVPSMLELEDEPLITVRLLRHSMTSFGPYNEYTHGVDVRYRGEKYEYFLSLILDNESPVLAGREQYGFPKKFGTVEFNPSEPRGTRVMCGHVEHPPHQKILQMNYSPVRKQAVPDVGMKVESRCMNLRVLPSPIAGQPPSVRELMPLALKITAKEIWEGEGSVSFPEPSEVDPMHRIEIVRYESAHFLREANLWLGPTGEVYSV